MMDGADLRSLTNLRMMLDDQLTNSLDLSSTNSSTNSFTYSSTNISTNSSTFPSTNSLDLSSTSTMNLDLASSLTPRPSVIASAFSDNESLRFFTNGSNEENNGRINSSLEIDLELPGKINCAEVVGADCKKVKNHPNGEMAKEGAKNRKRKSTTEASNSDPEFDLGRTTMVGSYLEMRRKNNAAVKKSR